MPTTESNDRIQLNAIDLNMIKNSLGDQSMRRIGTGEGAEPERVSSVNSI